MINMKKSLRKPENWQCFEGLCKKLWGEIWKVPNKIKKNGRLGQSQSGVDIYAIPEGEKEYWGIQCKCKDEYIDANLTCKEIDNEIKKANQFEPKLQVFIIATTANKNVLIEKYVRKKDKESREKGEFEILLYDWADIVDLIEENRETYNYYVNNQQFKDDYSFQVYLDDFKKEKPLTPKCLRKIRSYKTYEEIRREDEVKERLKFFGLSDKRPLWSKTTDLNNFRTPNYALCKFEIILANEGNKVIEDWRLCLKIKDEFAKITDVVGGVPMGVPDGKAWLHMLTKSTYCNGNEIIYRSKDGKSLVQKDMLKFELWIEPLAKEYQIRLGWEIIAKDFNIEGELTLFVNPIFEDEIEYIGVESKNDIKEDEVIYSKAKKYYPKDEKKPIAKILKILKP
jgi:Restriction endonuclease